MSDHKKYLAFKLRNKTIEELQSILADHQKELTQLRGKQVTTGKQADIAKIGSIRKAIARQLTIINQKKRGEIKSAFQSRQSIKQYNEQHGTSYSLNKLPKELRPRLTRAIRKGLTKEQSEKKLLKQLKREQNFPQRLYALKC